MSTTRAGLEFVDADRPEAVAEAVRRLSEFDRGQEVRRATANTTVELDDDLILVTTGGVGITVTLPLAREAQRKLYHVKKIDAGVGVVTIVGVGGDTVEGGASVALAALNNAASFLPDAAGSAWWLV